MAFTFLHTLLIENPKLASQKNFFMDDLSSRTQSTLRKIAIQITSVMTNLGLSMHRAIWAILFLTLACSFSAEAANQSATKIAIVDVQAVIDNSVAVKHLRESIDKISEELSKELSAKEVEFKNMEATLVKKKERLKPEQFDIEVENFYKTLSAFQHETQKKKEKLERAHSDAIESVHTSTIKIIHKISKEKGFSIALPASQTLYSDESLNITEEVTKQLNETVTDVKLNY